MCKRISDFANEQNVLSENQFDCREKLSTYLALLKLTNNITEELTKVYHWHFRGLSKAFGAIDHSISIGKLNY